ncbi:MAG TPA: IS1595 family transposase, partial [Candidatus Dormibacteraeota bacterium]|nr:IS1595 family transposase [Candidatus Dormibacteraeota bacterium]
WPDGKVTCPTCGSQEVHFIASRRVWRCKVKHPRQQFSVKVGTIFEDSPIGFDKWLPAIWLITSAKNGISSYELHRSLGVGQKTAWFMLHRIRLAMQTNTFEKMGGKVEVDETFIGGKARFMHQSDRARKITGTGGSGKAAVMGLLERGSTERHSTVRAKVVENVRRKTLAPEVRANVLAGVEVFSDALQSYSDLDADYIHQVINHAVAYVEGNVHTNGIENFWSLLKRSLRGTYVSVEPFHLFRYLDEQALRFNTREDSDAARFEKVLGQVSGRRLTYGDLTGQRPAFAI